MKTNEVGLSISQVVAFLGVRVRRRKTNDREGWAIAIDVEGFSALLEATPPDRMGRALGGLHDLSGAVFAIGSRVYPGLPILKTSSAC